MQLESPHLKESVPATSDSISELIFRLVGAQDPFAIVAQSEKTFAQVLWTDAGFVLEYQTGSIDQHFRSERSDFTVQEIVTILTAYVVDPSNWTQGIAFARMDVPAPFSFRLGRILGKVLGHTLAALRPGSSRHG